MASQVSPGVVVNEFDFSDYAARISTAILGIAGWAKRGPIDEVTLITNERQLIDTFGYPPTPVLDTGIGTTAYRSEGLVIPAAHYLREGNQLYVVRVSNGAAAAAVTVFDNDSAQTALTLTATTKGSWPNSTERNVEFKIEAGTKGSNYFKLSIREKGVIREVYDNVTNIRTGDVDTDNLPENRITDISTYVSAVGHASNGNPATSSSWIASGAGTGGASGDDGKPTAASHYYDSTNDARGLRLFEDTDTVDVNIIAAPGVNSEISDNDLAVVRGMVSIAETRGDCIALIDPKGSISTVAVAREFINGGGATYTGASINSSYAAYYWPWVKVYDGYSSQSIWVPPSGLVAGVMARNDRVAETWYAPAGLQRGKINNAVAVLHNSTLGERETIYAAGEVINPIVNFSGDGITVWGQKTTQRTSTALDRVNVRRLLNYAKKVIATSVRVLIFQPNDAAEWRRFRQLVAPTLESIKARRGLYDFRVICDETTNPAAQIDQGIMRGLILMKPTKAAEVIQVDFALLSTGASFNEFVE